MDNIPDDAPAQFGLDEMEANLQNPQALVRMVLDYHQEYFAAKVK